MRKKGLLFGIVIIGLVLASFGIFRSSDAAKEDGAATIRIGYAQVREYSSFAQQLLKLAEELEIEGSIRQGFTGRYEGVDYDQSFRDGDTVELWNDICDNNVEGAKYQFVREAFFDMNLMKESDYATMVNRDDVDVTFAMGTLPGTYFREHETKNNFMVMLAADPVESGIVKSETERFIPNSFALIDNTSYQRQLEAGYKFLHFKKLGIVCEDSEDAYAYSAIDSVMNASKKLGFEVIIEHVDEPKKKADFDRYYKQLKSAYRSLINQGMDTLYITVSSIDYPAALPDLLNDSIIPNKIPTLAQDDVVPVINGALFGVSLVDYSEQANHVITQLRRYAENGVPFEDLEQVCECTPKIFMNYGTAEQIDFEVSFENLQLVDSVYR